jgi:hypothetical protein
MLKAHGEAVLRLRSPALLDLVKSEAVAKGYGLDLSSLVLELALDADKSYLRQCLDLVSGFEIHCYEKTLRELPDLYDLSDPKAFIDGASKEVGPGKSGLAKLAWIVYGPKETEAYRTDAAAALLRSSDKYALGLFSRTFANYPNSYLKDADYKKLVESVKDNANGSLFALLDHLGPRTLQAAPKDVMDAVDAYEAAGGAPNRNWVRRLYAIDTARDLDAKNTVEAAAAAMWLLKQAGPSILKNLDSGSIKYLKSKNLGFDSLGIDAKERAAFLSDCAKGWARTWLDSYYDSFPTFNSMPDPMLLALKAPGASPGKMVYDEAVLEAITGHVAAWKPKLVEAFIKRAVDLTPEWAEKLREVAEESAAKAV